MGRAKSAMRTTHIVRRVALSLIILAISSKLGPWAFSQNASAPPAQAAVPDTAEGRLGKGYDALKQELYEDAAEQFRAALALDPSLGQRARFPMAVALFQQHKSAEARRELEAIRRQTGDQPNVWYYLGRLDIEDRDFAGAIKNLSQAIAQPPFPDTAYYLGFACFKQGDLPNAEKWLKEAERLTPRDSRVPYQLAFVYRQQGRAEEAQKSLALSQDLHREEASGVQLRAECGEKLDKGPRDEARAFCDKLYEPDDAERLTSLGMIYGQHGDLQDALKPFLRAAELSPQSPQVQYNLALTYFQLNRFEDARKPLEQATKRWPDLYPLNALLGAVLAKLGEDIRAYEVLRHALQLNSQDPSTADLLYATTVKLAEKDRKARNYADALRYYDEAAKLRPQDPEPHRSMAEIYAETGRPAQAAEEKQQAERLTNR